jgi:hypothetical protein
MQLAMTLAFVLLLAYLFAQVEVHIEGDGGWGANLPTWRIEQHWMLDLFWGGRAMTGYHAWVFPFIALIFHFPLVLLQQWSMQLEARVLACIIVFWIAEDFLWFLVNPAFGWKRFAQDHVAWHKHWVAGAPVEYWIFSVVAAALLWLSA